MSWREAHCTVDVVVSEFTYIHPTCHCPSDSAVEVVNACHCDYLSYSVGDCVYINANVTIGRSQSL